MAYKGIRFTTFVFSVVSIFQVTQGKIGIYDFMIIVTLINILLVLINRQEEKDEKT